MIEVTLHPNRFRPGVGLRPARVPQRPWLPQHARLCPVLEAGSALGYLVYPPLRPDEAFQVTYADTRYHLTYFREVKPGQWETIFRLTFTLPGGGMGSFGRELALSESAQDLDDAKVAELCDALVFPVQFGQPAGAVGLRGTVDFRTPAGWDTVYGPVANHLNPPVLPCLTVRVETDWYAHDTEFRYVLQPGDLLHVAPTLPIGQVFFVPREETALRDGTEAEFSAFCRDREAFDARKAVDQATAPYGMRYSPLYQKMRQDQRGEKK
jgi:hypothetical protein